MKKKWLPVLVGLLLVAPVSSTVLAQHGGRGLVKHTERAFQGYTLFAPLDNQKTYLIDMDGHVVHTWDSKYVPANSVFLLPNGDLLRAAKVDQNERFGTRGPSGGRIEKFDWDGNQTWDFVISDDHQHQHHDIEPLPNGNVLAIVWEHVSTKDAINAGRLPEAIGEEGIWPEKIIEVKQTGPTTGEIVWLWRSWDHLIQDVDRGHANFGNIAEHPERIDVNIAPRPRADWMHANGIDYNPELDQIIISLRSFNEFFVIDHSTTTEEAAGRTGGRQGHGGDILYRWGNPSNYHAGSAEDRKLFGQHDARWVDAARPGAGNITVFNNGSGRPDGEYSSVDEIVPPMAKEGSYTRKAGAAFGPPEPIWSYTAPDKMDFYSSFISGAERQPNGNTLICAGAHGSFIEVTPEKDVVWQYLNPFVKQADLAPPPGRRGGRPNASPDRRDRSPRDEGARNDGARVQVARDEGVGNSGAESQRPQDQRPRERNSRNGTNPGARQGGRGGSPQSPHIVFRVVRYAPDYPGLAGRDLNPISGDADHRSQSLSR